jgi:uncharacterized protein
VALDRYPSGQRGLTVNQLALPSEVRILPGPPERSLIVRDDSARRSAHLASTRRRTGFHANRSGTTDNVALNIGGQKLVGIVHLPAANEFQVSVILLHGGPGGTKEGPSDLFVLLGERLAGEGLTAVRFDHLGSGESDGDYVDQTPSTHVEQFRAVIDWLASQGTHRLGVVGESFGATCALGGYDDRVNALALLWPAIWLMDGTFEPLVAPNMSQLQEQGWIDVEGQRVGRAFVDELLADDSRESQLRNVAMPTLLIHGDHDSEVPVHQSEKAYEILPEPKRLIVVPRAEHCLRNPHEQQIVLDETVSWLTDHLRGGLAK